MKVISINIAQKSQLEIGDKTVDTGIFKVPVGAPVHVGALGVEGDTVVETSVRGGEDQAVYLYSLVDYQWWGETLNRTLEPGYFGENITVSAFPEQPLRIGDRLTINGLVHLEITGPRVPCVKLATRMRDPTFGKKFVKAVRPGMYARVLQPGKISSGDEIVWEHTKENFVYANDVFIEMNKKNWSLDFFQRALQSPISKIARAIINERLALKKSKKPPSSL